MASKVHRNTSPSGDDHDVPSRRVGADEDLGLGDNPLDVDPLTDAFYGAPSARTPAPSTSPTSTSASMAQPAPPAPRTRKRSKGRQPLRDGQSFRLVTFSFYEEDVARLDALLAAARKQGHRRTNRSQIVRLALRQVDLDGLPEEI